MLAQDGRSQNLQEDACEKILLNPYKASGFSDCRTATHGRAGSKKSETP